MSFKYEKIGLRRDRNLADLIDNEQGLTNLLNDLALPGEKFVAADLKVIDNLSQTNVTAQDFNSFTEIAPKSTQIRYARNIVVETSLIDIPFNTGTTFVFDDVLYEVINILQPVPPEETGNVNGNYESTLTIQTAAETGLIEVDDVLNIANQPFTVKTLTNIEKTQNVFTVSPLLTIKDQVEFFRLNTGTDPLFGVGRGPNATFYPISEIDLTWLPDQGAQYLQLDTQLFNSLEPISYVSERYWDNGTFVFENNMFDVTAFNDGYGVVRWEGYVSLTPFSLSENLKITTNGNFVFEQYDDEYGEWKLSNYIIDGAKFYLGVPYETNIGSIGPEDLALPDLGPSQFVVYDPTGRTFNLLNPVPLNVGISAGAIIPGYFHPNGAPVTVESVQASIFSTVVTIRAVEYINGEGETILSPGAAFRDPTAGEKSENPDAYLNPWEKYNILNAPAVLNGTLASTYLSQDFKSYTCGNNNTRELFLSQNVILKPKNKLVNEKQRVRITNWYPSLFSNAQYNKKVFAVNAGQTSAYSFTKIHNEYNEDNEAQNVGSLYSFNENLISLSNPKVDESVTINDLVKIEYEPSFEINYLNLHTDVESFFEGVSPYTLIDLNISVSTVLENMASPLFMQTDRRGLVEDWKDNSHPDLISQGDIALIIQSKKRRRITHINQTVKDRIYENLPTGNYEPINNLSGETFPIVNDDWISGTLVFNATESVNIVLSDEFTHSCPDIHYKVPVSDIIATSGTTQALIRDIDSLFIEHDSDAWSGIELDAKIPSADVIYLKNYGIVDILSEGNFNGETGFKSLSHANALTGLSTSPKSLKPGQLVQTYYYPSDDMYRKGYAQVSYSLDVTSSFNYNPTTGVFTIPGHDFGNFELVRVSWNDAFAPVNVAPPENDPELYTQRYVLLKKVEGSDDDFELLLNPTLSAGSIGAVVQELYNSVSSSITKWIPQIEPGATVPHIVLYSFGMVHGDIEYLRTIDSRISASSNELEKNVVLPAFTYFANRGADPQIGEVDQIVAVITTESGTDVNGANTFKFVLPDNLAGGNIFAAEGGITTKFMLNGWETFQDKVFTVRETIEDGFGKQVIFETSEQLIQFQNNGDVVPKAVTVGEVVKIYDASTARANTQYPNININVISSKYDPIEVGDKRIEFFEISPLQTRTNLTMTIDTVDFDETTGEVSMTFRNTYNIPQSQMLTSEAYNGYDNLGVDVDPDPKFIHVVRHDKGLYDASTYEFCKDIISIPLTQDVPAGANVLTVADTTNLNIGQVVQFAGFIPTAATIVNKTQTTITISASTLKELKQDYVLTVADDNLQDYELCSVSLNTAPPFEGTEDGLKTVAGNENLIVNDIVFDGLILNNQPVSQIGVDTNGNIDYSYTQSIDITYADQKTDGQTVYKLAIK